MTDCAIVTVQTQDEKFRIDMELPLSVPISELSKGILETLKEVAPNLFGGYEKLTIWYGKRKLLSDETMESNSIWDGSIIYIGGKQ